MSLPTPNPDEQSKSVNLNPSVFAAKEFWNTLKLGNLPPIMKFGVAVCFVIGLSATVLGLAGRISGNVIIFSWIYMGIIWFVAARMSINNEKTKK